MCFGATGLPVYEIGSAEIPFSRLKASQTLRHITGLDVVKSSAVVKDGKITEYHVNVKLAFIVEGAEIEKP